MKPGLNTLEPLVVVREGGGEAKVGEQLHLLVLGNVVGLEQTFHDA